MGNRMRAPARFFKFFSYVGGVRDNSNDFFVGDWYTLALFIFKEFYEFGYKISSAGS